MVGLPISQGKGLKRAVKVANGADLNSPLIDPSILSNL